MRASVEAWKRDGSAVSCEGKRESVSMSENYGFGSEVA
jgi:hypothetical protein